MAQVYEEVLQGELLKIIQSGQFYDSIQGIEEIDRLNERDYDEDLFPKFTIDYLLRQKAYRSAKFILQSLKEGFTIINGNSIRSVSLQSGEYLMPDFLLVNDETQQVIIIELKREKNAERQTVTEITGYAHEVKNHLPFLADYNFSFVIVSTEYNTLLQHSVGNLLLNNTHKVLCLNPVIKDNKISCLDIVLPNSWSDLDINYLDRNFFFGKELHIHFENVSQPLSLLTTAMDLIVRDGERNHSHGFILLCKLKDKTYSLKIYILNPYNIFKKSLELNMTPKNQGNPLAQYILGANGEKGLERTIRNLAEQGMRYFAKYTETKIIWGDNSDWEHDRQEAMSTALPLYIDSWGIINEFTHEIFLHPGASDRFVPEAYLYENNFHNPEIGLQIIDQITKNDLFAFGKIKLNDLFHFGSMLGMCQKISDSSKLNFEMLAFLNWLVMDLAHPCKEVGFRCQDCIEELCPPTLQLTTYPVDRIKENVSKIEEYIKWMNGEFLEGNSKVFKQFFNLGVQFGWSLNTILKNKILKIPEGNLTPIYDHLTKIMKQEFNKIIEFYYDEFPANYRNAISTFLDTKTGNKNLLLESIHKLNYSQAIERFDLFLVIMTFITDEVYHVLRNSPLQKSVDWEFLKQKVNEIKSTGNFACGILRDSAGVFKVFEDRNNELVLLHLINTKENEVIFLDESDLIPFAKKVTWDFLEKGNYK
ncbi:MULTISPECIES: hypothetical protein [Bacillus]|uniref:hypothetical protein n=1 Tax=Bacillus TaxID=1386 RepID=UPI000BF64B2D|nr:MULTISPECIES: hypothetical protein [Bacillus]KAA1804751.1 hypothetical protein FXB61_004369 [Bacillus cereus]PFA44870.1 hypothetical protein CN381_14060 [Bacillus cereus]PKS13573.1 hypothetical protein CX118_28815 [Bacillus sp. BI3]HDR7807283.1 hypothetical protein [Bacillus cereus]HDR8028900.1 hypothetical protein [Bacillus cereus]